jgi:hypothetical protein
MGILHTVELLLNCLWLTLALPAIWIWRRERRSAGLAGYPYRCRSLVLLGCLLALLFPTVSATDDLHAMSLVMEESSPATRIVKQSGGSKSPVWAGGDESPARLVQPALLKPQDKRCESASEYLPTCFEQAPASGIACRAPPRVLESFAAVRRLDWRTLLIVFWNRTLIAAPGGTRTDAVWGSRRHLRRLKGHGVLHGEYDV